MEPDLALAGAIAAVTMAAVAGLKKAWPTMAGATTSMVALGVSLVGTILGYLAKGGLTPQSACHAFATWIAAWVGSIGVAWAVRNPKRPNPWADQ